MPIFDVCVKIPDLPDPLELHLPGGIALKSINLEELAQPAIAPLGPFVKVVDGLMALFDAITGLKDALTSVPPDFTKAVQALDRLTPMPQTLAGFLPPVAFPRILLTCIDIVLQSLTRVRSELLHLNQQLVDLVHVEKTAQRLGDVRLGRVFECAKHNVNQEVVNLGKGMASIGSLMGLIETLASLAQLPLHVPKLTGFDGVPLDEAIKPLDDLIETFTALRKAVPL